MNVIRLYTTGNITGLTIHDMGELELIHPVSGLTINEFFTENEILNSQDLKDAISNEYIYLLDEYYKPIDDIEKFAQTLSYIDYMIFNTGVTMSPSAGTLFYDFDSNSLSYKPFTNNNDVTINIGQETIIRVYNNTGTLISNGSVCHINGSIGDEATVCLASSEFIPSQTSTTSFVSGVATHDIENNSYGFITRFGLVRDINTSSLPAGTQIFLSDSVPGGFTSLDGLTNKCSRANVIGRVITTGTTDGVILVNLNNENEISNISQRRLNDLNINNASTGIVSFDGISINIDNTKFNIGNLEAWFADNSTDPLNPTIKYISFSGITGITPQYLLTDPVTYIAIDKNSNVIQKNLPFTNSEIRSYIDLGVVVHTNNTFINAINNQPIVSIDLNLQLYDLIRSLGFFNVDGNIFSSNGANLKIDKSSGYIFKQGSNFTNDIKNPHQKFMETLTSITFNYRLQDSTEYTGITNIDPNNYDINGVLTAIPNKKFTIQRIAIFSSNLVRIQYGQMIYDSLDEAIRGIQNEPFIIEPNIKDNGLIRCYLILKQGITDLSDSSTAIFVEANRFGNLGGVGAGITVATLQTAYNNSSNPEITTDSERGSLDLRSYVGGDTAVTLTIQNANSDINAYIRADGFSKFSSVSANTFYGNLDWNYITNKNIYLDDLQDVNTANTQQGYYLSYSAGTWVGVPDSTDLSNYYTKQEVYNTGQTYTITQINTILTGFTEMTVFYNHTGNTNNPHQTSFDNLTSTAHTHIIEDVTNLQTELNSKTNLTDFNSHTGDTTIHFTKESILFNDLNDVDTGGTLDNYFVYYTGGTWKSRTVSHNELVGRNDWNQHSLSSITWKNDTNDLFPQYNNVQTVLSNYLSSTSMNGFDLTDNGDGTINIGYGSAVMRIQDLETSELIGTYFSGQTSISLTNNTTNYIYISYSGGTLHLIVDTDIVDEIGLSRSPIYFIDRIDNNLDIVDMRFYGRNYITKNARKDFFLYGYEHQAGGSIISDNTTIQGQVKFDVSNGTFFVASNQINHDNFDSDTDTFTYIYGSGGTYTKTTGSTILDYSHWDNLGILSSATLNYYTVHYLYVILDYRTGFTNYAIVYGRGEYDSLESAKSAPILTTDLSPEVGLYSTGRFIGKLITKNESGGPTSIADIQSPFTTVLSSSVATTHNTLGGLQGGMSNQYYHLTQTHHDTLTNGSDASTLHNHNTQYYTKTQNDSNYLSANTFDNIIITNGINNNGNITATTYYGDGSYLTGISTTTTLSALTDTTINNPQTGHTLIYSGNTWLNSMYDWNYLINTPTSVTFEEATGGTSTIDRLWSPERVKQAIEALSGGEEQDLPSLNVLIDGSHSLSANGVYAVIPFVIKQLENEPTIIEYTSSTGFTIFESGVYMISFNSNVTTTVSQSLGVQIRKNGILISGGTSIVNIYRNEQHELTVKVVDYVESGSTISVYGASATATSGVIGNGGLSIVKMSALKGAVGPKGDKGLDGADGDITWEGNWSISSGYTTNQAVYYQGTSYVCILDNTGQIPTTASTYWDVLALRGESGGIDLSLATGILSVEKGGTNITGYTQGDILYASNSNTLVKLPKGTSGQTLMMNSGATAPEWQSVILGTYFQETSNDTQVNFTNTAYLQRLNITTPNLPNGRYRVAWNAEISNANTNNSTYIRIQHNDTTTYNEATIEPKDTTSRFSVGGFFYITISGVNTFDMDYRVNGNTGNLRYARMEFWRIS